MLAEETVRVPKVMEAETLVSPWLALVLAEGTVRVLKVVEVETPVSPWW